MGTEFLFGMMKRSWKGNNGDGCVTLRMYLTPLNRTLKSGSDGKIYVTYILQQ